MAGLSLPYADISADGSVVLRKLPGSGGELSSRTCAQQLIYEIGDPEQYFTPDVIADFSNVRFKQISKDAVECVGALSAGRSATLLRLHASAAGGVDGLLQLLSASLSTGVKQSAEASFGGFGALQRGHWADAQVRCWMEEERPMSSAALKTYFVGWNSLYLLPISTASQPVPEGMPEPPEVRIRSAALFNSSGPVRGLCRWDGLFNSPEDAQSLVSAVAGLGLSGPAGIGGIFAPGTSQHQVAISKSLVPRDEVKWSLQVFGGYNELIVHERPNANGRCTMNGHSAVLEMVAVPPPLPLAVAEVGQPVSLYHVCHSRAGDKGNSSNVSLIPYDPADLARLRPIITKAWVKDVFSTLLDRDHGHTDFDVNVFVLPGVCALNILLTPVLDGGVTISRRIDPHGKSLSDLVLQQVVVFQLPRVQTHASKI